MSEITEATLAHVAVIAGLHEACFDGLGDAWDAESVADILAMPGAFGFIVGEADAPAGFMLARAAADEAEIISIGILGAWRRQGLASVLLTAVRDRLESLGCNRLFLEVAADNTDAAAFYRSRGFVEKGRRKNYYRRTDHRVDALILRLDLAY